MLTKSKIYEPSVFLAIHRYFTDINLLVFDNNTANIAI